MSTVTPYLCIKNAAQAVDFYAKAFGAVEPGARITDSTGRIGHTEIRIGDSKIYIADEHPEFGFRSPQSLGGSHMQFVVSVPDVDAMIGRAVAAGGKLTRPIEDQFYGDRTGEVIHARPRRVRRGAARGAAERERQRKAAGGGH
jgi:PhnB protein